MPSERSPSRRSMPVPEHRISRRSVGFLERDGGRWVCFLVSYPDGEGSWRGCFSFRSSDGQEADEIRTAEIFVEDSESEIHHKARGLGRPLLGALLDSALHVRTRESDARSPFLRRWLREMLAERSLIADRDTTDDASALDLDELRSLYASYRLDQVAHFVALVPPEDFDEAVGRILDGQGIDFAARDRIQLSMLVIEYVESRLPLPPFEIWVRDYLAHVDRYRAYAFALHRDGLLP
jgi:hypothetical protein